MTGPLTLPLLTRPSPERGEPLSVQVYRDLLAAIRDGRLGADAALPSSRAAAEALGLSRGTMNAAYDLLRAEGAISVRRGAAPRVVAPTETPRPAPVPARRHVSERGARLSHDHRAARDREGGLMAPGEPSEALFPADEWARALRRAARRRHGGAAFYAAPDGLPELRRVLARRLAADRGVVAEPEQILITPGTQASVALAAQVLTDPGQTAALEAPGWLGARAAFHGAGLRIAALPVDGAGAVPDALPPEARLIYLTPSNQFPSGMRLSHARRSAFLSAARMQGALILEDDYDSEFMWRGREIAALAAEARAGEAIHLGSASKSLLPALRLGWMVAPPDLVEPLRRAQRNFGLMANLHAQAALAEMMDAGRYRAQLRRIARDYEARGRALAAALSKLDGVAVTAPDGGVQLTARFGPGRREDAAMEALAGRGFRPTLLSSLDPEGRARGLVVGFADATPARIAAFVAVLDEAA